MSTTNYTRKGDGKNRKSEEKKRRRPLLEIAFERRKKLSEKFILAVMLFEIPAKYAFFLPLRALRPTEKLKIK